MQKISVSLSGFPWNCAEYTFFCKHSRKRFPETIGMHQIVFFHLSEARWTVIQIIRRNIPSGKRIFYEQRGLCPNRNGRVSCNRLIVHLADWWKLHMISEESEWAMISSQRGSLDKRTISGFIQKDMRKTAQRIVRRKPPDTGVDGRGQNSAIGCFGSQRCVQ